MLERHPGQRAAPPSCLFPNQEEGFNEATKVGQVESSGDRRRPPRLRCSRVVLVNSYPLCNTFSPFAASTAVWEPAAASGREEGDL